MLRDARQAKGLELSDVAEITHVRKEYLKALEADDYSALPEDIYTKNFVKLFAQTVGLQEDRMLDLYARARGRAPAQVVSVESAVPEAERPDRVRPAGASRPPFRIGAWLPIVLFIGLIVGLALWGFSNFSRPTRLAAPDPSSIENTAETDAPEVAPEPITESTSEATPETPTVTETLGTTDDESENPATEDGLFALSISTDPPGAEVTIDGFVLPGTTPLTYRLSPGTDRTLLLNLADFEPYEESIDLSNDVERTISLTPEGQTAAAPSAPEDAPEITPESGESAEPAAGASAEAPETTEGLSITVTETTWLEAYQSTGRGVGERLVYTTAQPGQSFSFELPVFLHVGNAGGVDITQDGQALGAMGSSGEVISRAYTP